MARSLDAVCKLCRREGTKLFLKGDRCVSDKCAVEKKPYAPGEHGKKRSKGSEYNTQLREKQKAKRIYGLLEKQFRNYYDLAVKRKGITGEVLLQLLETRLDNVIYRFGFSTSRKEARQLVGHGHLKVNGRIINISSYHVKPRDVISVDEKSSTISRIKSYAESSSKAQLPTWLEADYENLSGKIIRIPSREEIDLSIREQLIVELYSK